MILDGHIHIRDGAVKPRHFIERLQDAGVDGGLVISLPPPAFRAVPRPVPASQRLENLRRWCSAGDRLYPFYWIDPVAADALAEVDAAVAGDVAGFKVICDRYLPEDARAMRVFAAIAQAKRPILFHSGILWDGKASSAFNRPAGFEALLGIAGLTFALAHLSWPWCDECIAVYGKFLNAAVGAAGAAMPEMFIDITPGTPPVYRRDALTKLFTVGYDVADNVVFGSDSCVNDYNAGWVRDWVARDREIFAGLDLDSAAVAGVFAGNLQRFLGLAPGRRQKRPLRPGE
jgi:predicted TIM-barrel fold metal-dependent hydrolase